MKRILTSLILLTTTITVAHSMLGEIGKFGRKFSSSTRHLFAFSRNFSEIPESIQPPKNPDHNYKRQLLSSIDENISILNDLTWTLKDNDYSIKLLARKNPNDSFLEELSLENDTHIASVNKMLEKILKNKELLEK